MFLFCKSVHVRRFISENQCFFELWINHLLEVLLEKSLLAFLNFMFLTMVIKSFSNAKTYLTCFGECNAFSSYLSTLPFCLHLVLYIIVFNLILFIFSSIFSTIVIYNSTPMKNIFGWVIVAFFSTLLMNKNKVLNFFGEITKCWL